MIILFEGLDGAGKTNIAKALSQKLDYPYFKKPNEHGAFDGTYIPEYSLIYETRKFLEFYEQSVIESVVIDRDYPSEYVYGQIFRKKIYDELKINDYIKEYDKRFFKNELLIIYCYKTNHDNFEDEVIKKENIEKIKQFYKKFLNGTLNRVLMLDTTDENLEKQVETIQTFFKKSHEIYRFNEKVYNRYSFENDQIYFPGSFRGDDILFIGQNPGQPNDEQSIKIHKHKFEDYNEFLLEHEISYRKSKYYKFISDVAQNLNLEKCQFSFTNLVKFSTENNRAPSKIEIENNKRILIKQIEIFKPKKIISYGSQAHEALNELNIDHDGFHHPSRYNYSKTERF